MSKSKLLFATIVALFALTTAAQASSQIGAYTTKGAWSFFSAPKLHPPKLKALKTSKKGLAPGYFFVATFKNLSATTKMVGESGPLILDSHLNPVWVDPIGTAALATDLHTQTYAGQPALSWWQGTLTNTGQTLTGEDVLVDQHYKEIGKPLKGQNGWVISEHELVVSGTDAWVTAYKVVPANLSAYGGPSNGKLLDCAIQEYNLQTGQLISTWDAATHIRLKDSYQPVSTLPSVPWDAYHVNSLQLTGSGTFLVSMRNDWAAYMVNAPTGAIEWTLGGKASTFKFGKNASFAWQHDVELHSNGEVSVFDDACCSLANGKFGKPSGQTRGLVLKLDTTKHTASYVHQYTLKALNGSNDTAFLGNTDLLPDGNVAVGFGSQPYFAEYNSSGKLLEQVQWPAPDQSYRAYVVNGWVGTPYFPPAGAARTTSGKSTVYASWDGATLLASWRVLAGTSSKHLSTVAAKVKKSGFETTIPLSKSYSDFEVQALDSHGKVLGSSKTFTAPSSGTKTSKTTPPPGY